MMWETCKCKCIQLTSYSSTFEKWRAFIDSLDSINSRDALIARVLLATKARFNSIARVKIEDIDFEKSTLQLPPRKKKNALPTLHSLPDILVHMIKNYLSNTDLTNRSPTLFITRNNKPVSRNRLNFSFTKAYKYIKGATQKMVPDSLRHIYPELIRDGYHDDIIFGSKNEQRT